MNLFGKKKGQDIAQLEETITQLKQENETLRERFKKTVEREKRALAERQQAHEEVKILKEKLEKASQKSEQRKREEHEQIEKRNVEKRIDAWNTNNTSSMLGTNSLSGVGLKRHTASKAKLFEILKELRSIRAERETLQTIYLQPKELPPKSLLTECPQLEKTVKNLAAQTGCAIFHDQNHIIHLLIIPPFTITHPTHQQSTKFNTNPLCKLFDPKTLILVVIAHAGHGFVMLATPNEVLSHKEVHSSVKSKHTKGGWSQRRFERLREEEIKHHTGKMRELIETILERKPAQIIVSGDKRILKELFDDQSVIYRKFDAIQGYVPEKILREILTTTIYTY
ncbi:hypothetical protein DRN97_12230 [Methanosarcinales archaeon]|nr:MAG: hypothetical protein DRN97_12230 [Methanosarcinales archaeon]